MEAEQELNLLNFLPFPVTMAAVLIPGNYLVNLFVSMEDILDYGFAIVYQCLACLIVIPIIYWLFKRKKIKRLMISALVSSLSIMFIWYFYVLVYSPWSKTHIYN